MASEPKNVDSVEPSKQKNVGMEMAKSNSYGSVNNDDTTDSAKTSDNSAKMKQRIKRVSSSDLSSTGTETGLNVSSTDEIIEFDDLIHHFGDCGRYQMLLFILMVPFICFIAFVFYSQFFITLVPEHYWCRVPELESLSVYER